MTTHEISIHSLGVGDTVRINGVEVMFKPPPIASPDTIHIEGELLQVLPVKRAKTPKSSKHRRLQWSNQDLLTGTCWFYRVDRPWRPAANIYYCKGCGAIYQFTDNTERGTKIVLDILIAAPSKCPTCKYDGAPTS